METLSKQRRLAIEKIRKSQQSSSGKPTTKVVKSAKAAQSTVTQGDPKYSRTAHREPYFPATEPYFYGTSRPAEAREKSARLIQLLNKFRKKNIRPKRVGGFKQNNFSFFDKINK